MSDDDYKVGRGKPPRHSRFKMGESGNPKGRPKGTRSLQAVLLKEFVQPITARENGREVRVCKAQMVAKVLIGKALSGDPKSIALALELAMKLEPPVTSQTTIADALPNDTDAAILADYLRRSQSIGGGDD